MNRLTTERRAQIIGMMVEGNSIRAIVRMTGASKNTIIKLLEHAGEAFPPSSQRARPVTFELTHYPPEGRLYRKRRKC